MWRDVSVRDYRLKNSGADYSYYRFGDIIHTALRVCTSGRVQRACPVERPDNLLSSYVSESSVRRLISYTSDSSDSLHS